MLQTCLPSHPSPSIPHPFPMHWSLLALEPVCPAMVQAGADIVESTGT